MHEGVMSMWERVNAFLTAQRPSRFCDDCIAESLEVIGKPEVQKATSALGTTDGFHRALGKHKVWMAIGALGTTDGFHRALGICSMCGKKKTVIQRA
jgi:hypothetical protein